MLRGIAEINMPNNVVLDVCVVHMNEVIAPKPNGFLHDYHAHAVHTSCNLPLASARNEGASQAKGEYLLFLDVDCIPHPECIKDYLHALTTHPDSLIMGEVYYLPKTLPDRWNQQMLRQTSSPHPSRTYLTRPTFEKESNYGMFWSLNFALKRSTYSSIGGFDERFVGYGAEDTDFAMSAKHASVPLLWCRGAACYHQFHGSISPPLHHFDDILANAQRYYDKWGYWAMEGWLDAFAQRGYIAWDNAASHITVLAHPTLEDIQQAAA